MLAAPRPYPRPPAPPSTPAAAPLGTPGRSRWIHGRVDPFAVGLVSLVVYVLHGYQGPLTPDLAVFTYGGEQVAKGVPPYSGVFNSVGPLADAVPGLAVWTGHLVGVGPLPSIRVLFTCLSALCCALLCILARDTLGSRAAGLVAPAVFLTFERFLQLASDGPREKTTMVVFLLAALILAGRKRWLGAGVCTALATLTWQPALLVAVAVVAFAALTSGESKRRALVRFLVGGATTSAVFVLWFVLTDSLRTALDGFIVVNLLYTSQPSAISQPGYIWSILWAEYHATVVVALLGLAAMLVLAARAVPAVRRSAGVVPAGPRRLVSIGAGCLVGCLWTIAVINGGPDLFELLPLAALGLAGVVVLVVSRVPRWVGVLTVTAVVCAGVVVAGVESVATRNEWLPLQRADVSGVLSTQPGDATIFSLNAPAVPALAERDSIWPWQLFDTRMLSYLDHTQPGGLKGLARRLAAERPTFVAMAHSYPGHWQKAVIRRDYWKVGHGPGWTWYLSRAAGGAALVRARAANTSAMDRYATMVSARAHSG